MGLHRLHIQIRPEVNTGLNQINIGFNIGGDSDTDTDAGVASDKDISPDVTAMPDVVAGSIPETHDVNRINAARINTQNFIFNRLFFLHFE